MQELLHAFGIDWRLLVFQTINFGILVGALWFFLYKPVLKMLREREEKIAQGVADAEKAAKEREEIESTKSTLLKGAEHEAQDIVSHAKQQGTEARTKIVKDAEAHAAALAKDADLKAKEVVQKSKKEAEKEISRLAILAAEKVLANK